MYSSMAISILLIPLQKGKKYNILLRDLKDNLYMRNILMLVIRRRRKKWNKGSKRRRRRVGMGRLRFKKLLRICRWSRR
jgi:hypothetical protein